MLYLGEQITLGGLGEVFSDLDLRRNERKREEGVWPWLLKTAPVTTRMDRIEQMY